MTKNCIGLMGWIFGHNYQSIMISGTHPITAITKGDNNTHTVNIPPNLYRIICQRCGAEYE